MVSTLKLKYAVCCKLVILSLLLVSFSFYFFNYNLRASLGVHLSHSFTLFLNQKAPHVQIDQEIRQSKINPIVITYLSIRIRAFLFSFKLFYLFKEKMSWKSKISCEVKNKDHISKEQFFIVENNYC